jgi:hypothetical protein
MPLLKQVGRERETTRPLRGVIGVCPSRLDDRSAYRGHVTEADVAKRLVADGLRPDSRAIRRVAKGNEWLTSDARVVA